MNDDDYRNTARLMIKFFKKVREEYPEKLEKIGDEDEKMNVYFHKIYNLVDEIDHMYSSKYDVDKCIELIIIIGSCKSKLEVLDELL